ncbi:MAG: VCBS repeat-containing protein [Planctomycetota bacterium]
MLALAAAAVVAVAPQNPLPRTWVDRSLVTGSASVVQGVVTCDLCDAAGEEIVSFGIAGDVRCTRRDPVTGSWTASPVLEVPFDWILFVGVIAPADVDGDGRTDLVVSGDRRLGVLFNETPPGASAPSFAWSAITGPLGWWRFIGTIDVDSNGRLDLVLMRPSSIFEGAIEIAYALGPRSYTAPGPLLDFRGTDAEAVDFDGDGDLDLVASGRGRLRSYRNDGGAWVRTLDLSTGTTGVSYVATGDLDGDGAPDAFVHSNGRIDLFVGDGVGGFAAGPTVPSPDSALDLELVDLDGDGLEDLAVGRSDGNSSSFWSPGYYRRTGPALFEPTGLSSARLPGSTFGGAYFDVSGDGVVDLVSATGWPTLQVQIGTLNTSGELSAVTIPRAFDSDVGRIAAAAPLDSDGDGDLDLVSVSTLPSGQQVLSVHERNAPRAYAASTSVAVTVLPVDTPLATGRFGDPERDGVAYVDAGGTLRVAPRVDVPAPAFTIVDTGLEEGGRRALGAFDMDGDGDDDLFAIEADGAGVGVIEQTAPGVFGPWIRAQSAAPGHGIRSAVTGDFNLDGRADLCWLETGPTALLSRAFGAAGGFGGATSVAVTPGAIDLATVPPTGGPAGVAVFSESTVEIWSVAAPLGPLLYTVNAGSGAPFRDVALRLGDGAVQLELHVARLNEVACYRVSLGAGASPPTSTVPIRGAGAVRLLPADLDRDGADDLLYWRTNRGPLNLLRSTADPVAVTPYCLQTVPNSLGVAATLDARALFGSYGITSNGVGLRLDAHDVPPGSAGMWLTSRTPGLLPVTAGELCLGGPFGRLNRPGELFVAGESGAAGGVVALDALPLGGSVAPALRGETWSFQAWYRDASSSRLTNAISVRF